MKIPIVHFNDLADGEPASPLQQNATLAAIDLDNVRSAQRRWAAVSIRERARVLAAFRQALTRSAVAIVRSLNPRDERHAAEILSSQVIPLADACRYLESDAEKILKPRGVPRAGTPIWLAGTRAEVRRDPYGVVLVIAPSNYPLFLPCVVVLQALAAGNAVVLKPGRGGRECAEEFLTLLHESGLERGLTLLLSEEPSGVDQALDAGVDKVIFTGSAGTGGEILKKCAERLVPAVMELSGSDAMFVRSDADVEMAAQALLFGLRLNRGQTCIAPRRVFVNQSRLAEFEAAITRAATAGEHWTSHPGGYVTDLVINACAQGARVVVGEIDHHGEMTAPVIVADGTPNMRLLREDHFCSVAAIVAVRDDTEALAFNNQCPYALGASIFSADQQAAASFAQKVDAGSVSINDLIVPTADARLPFPGRRKSGFGATRGAEGLLEMTRLKVVSRRTGTWRPHYESSSADQAELLLHYLEFKNANAFSARLRAAGALVRAAIRQRKR